MKSRRNRWFWAIVAVVIAVMVFHRIREKLEGPVLYSSSITILTRDATFPPDVLSEFERKYHIRVKVRYFDSTHELHLALADPKAHYDLAMPSAFLAKHLMEDRLLTTLDKAALPNLGNVDHEAFPLGFDPDNNFALPYFWGSVGIGYDSITVDGLPKSWGDFFRHQDKAKSKGGIALIDDPRYVLGSVLIYLGYSPNTEDLSHIAQAAQLLKDISDDISYIDTDRIVGLLATGKVSMALAWGPDVTKAMQKNKHVRLSLPREGSIIFRFCMVIPRSAPNPAGAERLINFLLDPQIAARVTNYCLCPTTIKGATPFVDRFLVNGPSYFRNPVGKNFVIDDISTGAEQTHLRLWQKLAAPYQINSPSSGHHLLDDD